MTFLVVFLAIFMPLLLLHCVQERKKTKHNGARDSILSQNQLEHIPSVSLCVCVLFYIYIHIYNVCESV